MKNKGFTFVELIIALTIFAVIALGIYSAFSTGLYTWRRGEEANRLQQEARWALDKMAKELRNAIIYNYSPSYPDTQLFIGEKNKISFLTLIYNRSINQSEIKRITYSLEVPQYGEVYQTKIGAEKEDLDEIIVHYEEKEASLNSLQRREESLIQSLQPEDTKIISPEPLTNLVKPEGLLFSYASVEEEGMSWKDNWDDKTKLPQGVRITLILQNPKNTTEEAAFTKTVFLEQGELTSE